MVTQTVIANPLCNEHVIYTRTYTIRCNINKHWYKKAIKLKLHRNLPLHLIGFVPALYLYILYIIYDHIYTGVSSSDGFEYARNRRVDIPYCNCTNVAFPIFLISDWPLLATRTAVCFLTTFIIVQL